MDLGATLCTRSKPRCPACPVNIGCQAYANNQVHLLPTPKSKKTVPQKQTMMLVLLKSGEVLLEKRPQVGIWAGLWSLPEIDLHEIATEAAFMRFGIESEPEETLPVVNHAFTHFKLAIHPQPLQVLSQKSQANQVGNIWLPISEAIEAAIPSPVRNILITLKSD
jgi:A/G-specific adenine glycosylase